LKALSDRFDQLMKKEALRPARSFLQEAGAPRLWTSSTKAPSMTGCGCIPNCWRRRLAFQAQLQLLSINGRDARRTRRAGAARLTGRAARIWSAASCNAIVLLDDYAIDTRRHTRCAGQRTN